MRVAPTTRAVLFVVLVLAFSLAGFLVSFPAFVAMWSPAIAAIVVSLPDEDQDSAGVVQRPLTLGTSLGVFTRGQSSITLMPSADLSACQTRSRT